MMYFFWFHFGVLPALISGNLIPYQYDALFALYISTHGPHWKPHCNENWNFNSSTYRDPCRDDWAGITCLPSTCLATVDCFVNNIDLYDCNLTGTLPPEIGNFSKLSSLDVSWNHLTGSIPSTFSHPTTLRLVDLSRNSFTGLLPELSTGMISVSFSHNSFSGRLPSSLLNSSSLNLFDIQQNAITGSIPEDLLKLPNLVSLVLDSNQLTGTIPGSISSKVQIYTGSRNLFHGTIPSLCATSDCVLNYFNFCENELTGSLPQSFLPATMLRLNISYNKLTGPIPLNVMSITHLVDFDVTSNLFTGSQLTFSSDYLVTINLGSNLFSGPFPHLPEKSLGAINLDHNYFSGSLDFKSQYSVLSLFSLSSNLFTSMLPSSFASLTFLQQLHLSANFLTSSIPIELATLPGLILLDLSDNQLSGTIPPQLFSSSTRFPNYSLLVNLHFHKNLFSGHIPSNICRAAAIRQVSLFNNLLSGSIPPLQNCTYLQTILLQRNFLTGHPGSAFEISLSNNFSLLQVIDLSDNEFSGTIPKQIFKSPNIFFVAIVGGCFKGNFPVEICEATTLNTLVLEGLRSGRNCRDGFWDPVSLISNRVYRTSTVGGSIPQCIWNLPNLETLYLSGNLIEGSIPTPHSTLPSSLTRLSLSFNQLTGWIPNILLKQSYEYFDLQHNRLTGTSEDIKVSDLDKLNQTHITLSVNRLSGHIGNLHLLKHIDVLSGNIYSCEIDRSDLPQNDPESSTYLCGSDALDWTLLFWILLTAIFFGGLGLAIFTIRYCCSRGSFWKEQTVTGDGLSVIKNPLTLSTVNEIKSTNTKTLFPLPSPELVFLLVWEYYQEVTKIKPNSHPELLKFLKTLSFFRQIAIQLSALASTVFLGFYLIMKLWFDSSTHKYQYRWLYSVAFLSNRNAAIALSILILSLFFFFVSSITRLTSQNEAIQTRVHSCNSSFASPEVELSNIPSLEPRPGSQDSENHNSPEEEDILIFSSPHSYTTQALLSSYSFISLVVTLDTLLVLLVKGGYVYFVMSRGISSSLKILLQIAVAVFDICWNTFLIPRLLMIFPSLMRPKVRVKLHLTLLMFNSIIAPVLATALTDRNCLADILVSGDEITSSGSYTLCDVIDTVTKNCISSSTVTLSTSFQPPYTYSYQCSSAILVNFIPVFILSYSLLTFIQPILFGSVIYFANNSKKALPSFILLIFPSILWMPHEVQKDEFRRVLFANPIISGLLHHVVVLLTFGIACPPLGIVIAISICVITFQWELIIGRYLWIQRDQRFSNVSSSSLPLCNLHLAVESSCVGVWMGPINSMYAMVDVSSLVYSILLFDIAGDRIGGFRAFYSFSIPMLCLPLLIRLGFRWFTPLFFRSQQESKKAGSCAEDIQVDVLESHSRPSHHHPLSLCLPEGDPEPS